MVKTLTVCLSKGYSHFTDITCPGDSGGRFQNEGLRDFAIFWLSCRRRHPCFKNTSSFGKISRLRIKQDCHMPVVTKCFCWRYAMIMILSSELILHQMCFCNLLDHPLLPLVKYIYWYTLLMFVHLYIVLSMYFISNGTMLHTHYECIICMTLYKQIRHTKCTCMICMTL